MKPVFVRESSPEITARVDHARSIIRGNGAYNIESVMLHLAETQYELLKTITAQCGSNEEDRRFWFSELCNPVPPENVVSTGRTTREEFIASLRAFTVLLHDSRRFLRTHRGNREYASTQLMRSAARRCESGGLEQTPELLKASLYLGIITADIETNASGRDNDLLRYMAHHLDEIENNMEWLTADQMRIAFLESHLNTLTHATLNGGWL